MLKTNLTDTEADENAAQEWEKTQARVLQALREHGGPSARTADPNHPVGRASSAILRALPHFQRWEVMPEEIIRSLAARYGPDSTPEPELLAPPGVAGTLLRVLSTYERAGDPGRSARLSLPDGSAHRRPMSLLKWAPWRASSAPSLMRCTPECWCFLRCVCNAKAR